MGANCRHSFYPVIDGISEPLYTEEELANIDRPPFEYDGKEYTEYEATQRQRYMERAIRKTKRELLAAENTNDKEQFTAKSVLLRRQKEEYNKFNKAAGLLTENERTQLAGFGRSQASKAVWAAKKAQTAAEKGLTNGGGSGMMNKKYNFMENSQHKNDVGIIPTYTNEEIKSELLKSETGKSAIEYIDNKAIYVEFDYTPFPPSQQKGWSCCGLIHVYIANNTNLSDVAKTIIHEAYHEEINSIHNSLREEFYCRVQENRHLQPKLSFYELIDIAREVQYTYQDSGMKWSEKNGYKRRRNN